VLKFWWHHLHTKQFPDDCDSLAQLVEFGRQHPVTGFNKECIRSYIFWRLFKQFNCTSFVETGTLYGETTSFVNKVFKTPIFTCEINKTYHTVSKINLLWARNIKKYLADSPVFLDTILHWSLLGDNPMFYLDAHWEDHVPLEEELVLIAERCDQAIILIDDFMIPWNSDFLYDEYPTMRIDLEVINTSLKTLRQDVKVFLPTYFPEQDPTGKGIGFAIALVGQNQSLPTGTFPFNLVDETA